MSMRQVNGDTVLTGSSAGAGTYTSGTLPTGYAADVLLMIHVTTATGTGHSLTVSLEESNDGSTWTAVPQSAAAALTAPGSALSNSRTTKQLVRVTATIVGTTPVFTYRVAALAFAD